MAKREWNVARNGQFGRLAKSAGIRRNPQQHAGIGAIGQNEGHGSGAERRIAAARRMSAMDGVK